MLLERFPPNSLAQPGTDRFLGFSTNALASWIGSMGEITCGAVRTLLRGVNTAEVVVAVVVCDAERSGLTIAMGGKGLSL